MKKITLLLIIIFTFSIPAISLANVAVINGLSHHSRGVSGEIIEGEIILLNTSTTIQRVVFSMNDVIMSCNASTVFDNESTHLNSSKSWFLEGIGEKELEPGEKYIYKYKLSVPENSTLKGSYWSMIMINVEKPIKKQVLENNLGVHSRIRYGIQIVTSVNDLDDFSMEFSNISLKSENEISQKAKTLFATVKNIGSFVEETDLIAEVYSTDGIKITTLKSLKKDVYPGFCKEFEFDIKALTPGDYTCVVIASSRDQYSGTNLSLTID